MAGRPPRVPRKAVHSRRLRGLGFGTGRSVEEAAHGAAQKVEVGPPGRATMLVPVAVVEGGEEVGEGREHGGEVCCLHVGGYCALRAVKAGVHEAETYKRRWRVPGRRSPQLVWRVHWWRRPAKNTMSLNLVEGTG